MNNLKENFSLEKKPNLFLGLNIKMNSLLIHFWLSLLIEVFPVYMPRKIE
jgi:hypothetical protein